MRYATLLFIAAATTACSPPTYVRVETGAETIEQPTPGQSLLAGAPIPSDGDPDDYSARFTLGGGGRTTDDAATGSTGAALISPRTFAGGGLAFNLGGVELELVARVGTTRGWEAPAESAPAQYGLRLRWTLGGEALFFNVAMEAGLRRINISQGRSLLCDVTPRNGGWVPAPGGTCWHSDQRRGLTDWQLVGYGAATLAPTFRLTKHAYLFGGVSIDTITHSYVREEIWTLYGGVPVYQSCESTQLQTALVGTWIAGLDLRGDGPIGLLVNVRGGGIFGPDIGPPSAEAALNVRF
jgi:hypothetical protein